MINTSIYSQNHKSKKYTNLNRSPKNTLKFKVNKDTIFLSVLVDSISPELAPWILYAYYPKSIKPNGNILISFKLKDTTITKTFKPITIDESDKHENFVQYDSGSDQSAMFCVTEKEYNSIKFSNAINAIPINADEKYFNKFFSLLYR